MKKLGILWLFMTVLFIPSFKEKYYIPEEDIEIGNRGAMHKEDLAKVVFSSLQMNQFEMLTNYLPNDNEIKYLERQSSRENKYIFEDLMADDLESNTKINFQKVIQNGIKAEINWSTVEFTDMKFEEAKIKDERMQKGIFTVQDNKGSNMKISFDMIKIKNKWFLFQGIRTVNQSPNTTTSRY